jgi:DNA-binding IclR family transcriptional regulator
MGEKREQVAPSVQRAMAIFELLASSKRGLTLSQIARSAGMARSSVFYILHTLEECGYVSRNGQRRRYTFTNKLFDLANRSVIGLDIRERAAPFLRALVQQTGLTVHLAVVSQTSELILIDKTEPQGNEQLPTWIGKRLPLHCSATGKALMAYMPEEQLLNHIRQGFVRYNENTIVSATKLREELARVRVTGFALDDEEETLGLRCIGSPIFDGNDQPLAAISVAGKTAHINENTMERLIRLVKNSAEAISASVRAEPRRERASNSVSAVPLAAE